MRRLFKIIFQLVAVAFLCFVGTAAWIVFSGLSDSGEKADVALVTDLRGADRAIKLYKEGAFPFIIVCGSTGQGSENEVAAVGKYLESNGVPASAIIEDRRDENTLEAARHVAAIMKTRQFESVMIVADYYRITRAQLALDHEGVAEIDKAHVGKLQKEDALKIGREVVALYAFIGKVYLLPAAEKAKDEAKVGMDKASSDAEKAKDSVDKSLDGLAK
jgi:uncharacterized SAM-binding protein YcdF (DUF218 family)